jgi:hypothetical protein
MTSKLEQRGHNLLTKGERSSNNTKLLLEKKDGERKKSFSPS